MLNQAEIDALLRSLSGETDAGPPEALPAAARPAPSLEAVRPLPPDLPEGIELLLEVDVTCSVDLGRVQMDLGELLALRRSSLIVLSGKVDSSLLLRVNGVAFAYGTVVETNGRYGIRITELAREREEAQAS